MGAEANRREILEFMGPYKGYWYVEGNSPVVLETQGGSSWFQFEEPYDKAVSELHKLGFTDEEIEAAKEETDV